MTGPLDVAVGARQSTKIARDRSQDDGKALLRAIFHVLIGLLASGVFEQLPGPVPEPEEGFAVGLDEKVPVRARMGCARSSAAIETLGQGDA